MATNLCLTKYPLRSMNGIHEWMFLRHDELLMPLAKTCRHAYVGTMERLLPHVFQFSSDQLLLQKMLALQKMLLLSFQCTMPASSTATLEGNEDGRPTYIRGTPSCELLITWHHVSCTSHGLRAWITSLRRVHHHRHDICTQTWSRSQT